MCQKKKTNYWQIVNELIQQFNSAYCKSFPKSDPIQGLYRDDDTHHTLLYQVKKY